MLAVQGLDPERRAVFDGLWQDARTQTEARFCASGADAAQGVTPTCLDWSALPAIAGDHSCSSADMLQTTRDSDWILAVADVAAQLKLDLAAIPVVAPPEASGKIASAVGTAIVIQLFAGADVPYDSSVEFPVSAAKPDLQTVWSLGLRIAFDWRYYW